VAYLSKISTKRMMIIVVALSPARKEKMPPTTNSPIEMRVPQNKTLTTTLAVSV
jgi:hypothetical protein